MRLRRTNLPRPGSSGKSTHTTKEWALVAQGGDGLPPFASTRDWCQTGDAIHPENLTANALVIHKRRGIHPLARPMMEWLPASKTKPSL
jgi:hypothetical protein